MTALAIHVKTLELAWNLLVDTTAAVQQVLLEYTVKRVSLLKTNKPKSNNQLRSLLAESLFCFWKGITIL